MTDAQAGDAPGGDIATPDPNPDEPANFPAGDEISGDAGGAERALLGLLSRHPFCALFDTAAPKLKDKSKARSILLLVCVTLDLVFSLAVVALLLAIIGTVAYKTLAPLPHF